MPEIVYYVAASLDGYIADSDNGIDWLKPFESGNEDYGYAAFYASVDAVIMGRRTYDQCLAFSQWPYPGKPCWVFSHRQLKPAEADVRRSDGSPGRLIDELQSMKLRRAWLVGGGVLAASFRAEHLITEYILSIVPVALGVGVPMLGASGAKEGMRLVETKSYPSGVVQLRYLPSVDA